MHVFGNKEDRYSGTRDELRSTIQSGSLGGVSTDMRPIRPNELSVFSPYTEMPMYDGPIGRELEGGTVPSEKMVLCYVAVPSRQAVRLMARARGATTGQFRESADDEHVEMLRKQIQSGDVPIPPVHIDVDGTVSEAQEGRHRIIAAAEDHDEVELLVARQVRR